MFETVLKFNRRGLVMIENSMGRFVCCVPPGNDLGRLVSYYRDERYPELLKPADDIVSEEKRFQMMKRRQLEIKQSLSRQLRLEGAPLLKKLEARSLQAAASPLRIFTNFLLFISDIQELYRDYSDDPNIKECMTNVLNAYVDYRYQPNSPEMRENFSEAFTILCNGLEECFPLTYQIKRDFEVWSDIINKNVDTLEFTPLEFRDICDLRKKGKRLVSPGISPEDCLVLIRKVSTLVESLLEPLETEILKLLEKYPEESIADSWNYSEEQYLNELKIIENQSGANNLVIPIQKINLSN